MRENSRTTEPMPTATDAAQIQAMFDAQLALMADQWTACTSTVNKSGGAMNATLSVSDAFGSGYTVTSRVAGPTVAISPIGATLAAAETLQFAATVTDNAGAPVPAAIITWSVSQGKRGTIDDTGLYTAPAAITAAVSDAVTATDTASGSSATVTVGLQAGTSRDESRNSPVAPPPIRT